MLFSSAGVSHRVLAGRR